MTKPTVERTPVEEAREGVLYYMSGHAAHCEGKADCDHIEAIEAVEESIQAEAVRPYVEAIQAYLRALDENDLDPMHADEIAVLACERRLRALVDSIPEQGEMQ